MKSILKGSPNHKQESIEKKLDKIELERIARESGFIRRKPKKIPAKEFLMGFIMVVFNGCSASIESWASEIGILIGETISKQGLWKRMVEAQIIFLQKVLEGIVKQSIKRGISTHLGDKLRYFKNILLEDSTKIMLNEKLVKDFPGKSNGKNNKQKGILKIHTMYNVMREEFPRFDITSYRKNDQSMSSNILGIAKAGDLIIRDLGYFVLGIFKEFTERGIYFISRFKYNVKIYDEKGKSIDLVKELRGKDVIDIDIIAGQKERAEVRLVAIRLDAKTASKRRRKSKSSRDNRTNHSKKYLTLLGWEIFITNISRDILTATDINKIYGIRWRIEIIFKCWKSYFKVTDIPKNANKIRVESYIYCMLIFITLFQIDFYKYYEIQMLEQTGKEISIIKFSNFIRSHVSWILVEYFAKDKNVQLLLDKFINYYCSYGERKKRENFYQKFN
jgi:hypothetical protein